MNRTRCFETVKAPVAVWPGAAEFTQRFGEERAKKAATAAKEIVELPDRHVALHLLRQAGDFCRIGYLARTTPSAAVSRGLEHYDAQLAIQEQVAGVGDL